MTDSRRTFVFAYELHSNHHSLRVLELPQLGWTYDPATSVVLISGHNTNKTSSSDSVSPISSLEHLQQLTEYAVGIL